MPRFGSYFNALVFERSKTILAVDYLVTLMVCWPYCLENPTQRVREYRIWIELSLKMRSNFDSRIKQKYCKWRDIRLCLRAKNKI